MFTTERKLIVGTLVVGAATIYLAYLGATASWRYYLTVDECLADSGSLQGRRARVSGIIAPGSLTIAKGRESARFAMSGESHDLMVVAQAPLPDNLREEIQVVVEGYVQPEGWLKGERVMTRCASKYAATPEQQGSATFPASTGTGR